MSSETPVLTPRKQPVRMTSEDFDKSPRVQHYRKEAGNPNDDDSAPSFDPLRFIIYSFAWVFQQAYLALFMLWGQIAVFEIWALANGRKYLSDFFKTVVAALIIFGLYIIFVGLTDDFGVGLMRESNVTLHGEGAEAIRQYVANIQNNMAKELKNGINTVRQSQQEGKVATEAIAVKLEALQRQVEGLGGSTDAASRSTLAKITKQIKDLQKAAAEMKGKAGTEDVRRLVTSELSKHKLTPAQSRRIVDDVVMKLRSSKTDVNEAKILKVVEDYVLGDHGVGRVDYAQFSSIVSAEYNSPDYGFLDRIFSLLSGQQAAAATDEILKRDMIPGKCWAFSGAQANVTLALHCPIVVTHVTLDHLLAKVSPTKRKTAPKTFEVWGKLKEKQCYSEDEPCVQYKNFGTFTYNDEGSAAQTFELNNSDALVSLTYRFKENYGHHYTCVYRLRVHGEESHFCNPAPANPEEAVEDETAE